MTIRMASVLVAVFCTLASAPVAAQSIVANPSFESGALAPDWRAAARGSYGGWAVASGAPPATDGQYYAEAQFSFLDGVVLYQDVTIPAEGQWTLQVAMGCNFANAKSAADLCRFDVTDTSAESVAPPTPRVDNLETTARGVLVPVFAANGDRGNAAMGDKSAVKLAGLGGKTVRLRAVALASTGQITVTLDNVRIVKGKD